MLHTFFMKIKLFVYFFISISFFFFIPRPSNFVVYFFSCTNCFKIFNTWVFHVSILSLSIIFTFMRSAIFTVWDNYRVSLLHRDCMVRARVRVNYYLFLTPAGTFRFLARIFISTFNINFNEDLGIWLLEDKVK